jgi:hypothetical protein
MSGGVSSLQTWRTLGLLWMVLGLLWMVHHETRILPHLNAQDDLSHRPRVTARSSSASSPASSAASPASAAASSSSKTSSRTRSVDEAWTLERERRERDRASQGEGSGEGQKEKPRASATVPPAPKAPGCWKTRPSGGETKDAPFGTMAGGCLAASEDWQNARVMLDEHLEEVGLDALFGGRQNTVQLMTASTVLTYGWSA